MKWSLSILDDTVSDKKLRGRFMIWQRKLAGKSINFKMLCKFLSPGYDGR